MYKLYHCKREYIIAEEIRAKQPFLPQAFLTLQR